MLQTQGYLLVVCDLLAMGLAKRFLKLFVFLYCGNGDISVKKSGTPIYGQRYLHALEDTVEFV
jgi:hypothetical protein